MAHYSIIMIRNAIEFNGLCADKIHISFFSYRLGVFFILFCRKAFLILWKGFDKIVRACKSAPYLHVLSVTELN